MSVTAARLQMPTEDQQGPGSARILIVDDNRAIHDDFRKILVDSDTADTALEDLESSLFGTPKTSRSCEIILDSAFQGLDAVEKVREAFEKGCPYTTAFVDVRMPPGIDGVDATLRMLAVDPEVQIVLCTAYSDRSWSELERAFAHTDRVLILKKPFDVVEVRQLVSSLRKKWALARQVSAKVHDLESMVDARTAELRTINQQLEEEMLHRSQVEVELRLAQKFEAIGQLAAGIAHEINTPMQYINSNLLFVRTALEDYNQVLAKYQQLRDAYRSSCQDGTLLDEVAAAEREAGLDYLAENIPSALEDSLDGIERVASIVKAMRGLSYPSRIEKSPVDLNEALRSALVIARSEYRFVAKIHLDAGDLPEVHCDVVGVTQVFLNLVVNAAHAIADSKKFTSENLGEIFFETRVEAPNVVSVTVRDTGCGIPDGDRDRVFDPFFTTKEMGRGTGQGLAIARAVVVEKHSGRIELWSEQGVGTSFKVLLPIDGSALPDSSALAPA